MGTSAADFSGPNSKQHGQETTDDRSGIITDFAAEITPEPNLRPEFEAYAISDSALVDTIGPSQSARRLRQELGWRSCQAMHQRVGRGTILALPTRDGATVYPIFQFIRRNGMLKVKPGLIRMFKILQGQEPWQVAVSVNTPAPELGGLSPVAWEKEHGDTEALEKLAETFVREWERS